MTSKAYRWCSVPLCTNTSIKTPEKLFIFVPFDKKLRKKWLELARRDLEGILPTTQLYFCEDHFDLPNDMANYMEYHVMGQCRSLLSAEQKSLFDARCVPSIIKSILVKMFRPRKFSTMKLLFNKVNSSSVASGNLTNRLSGKVAIVTASTEGIGLAIAKRLGQEGASVIVSSRKEDNVNKAVISLKEEGLKVEGIVCHVGNAEHRRKLIEHAKNKFGGVDILVSNAAVNPSVAPILETEEQVWDKIFDINVKSSWLLAKEVYPEFIKRGGGSIVFISSIAAYQPMEPLGTYSVSKTTLIGLSKAIANEIVHDNIRVNCVAPGIVETKFAAAITTTDIGKEKSLANVAMKRFGKPSEIAGAVAYLVSDDASYVTGETIVVAGGVHAHL